MSTFIDGIRLRDPELAGQIEALLHGRINVWDVILTLVSKNLQVERYLIDPSSTWSSLVLHGMKSNMDSKLERLRICICSVFDLSIVKSDWGTIHSPHELLRWIKEEIPQGDSRRRNAWGTIVDLVCSTLDVERSDIQPSATWKILLSYNPQNVIESKLEKLRSEVGLAFHTYIINSEWNEIHTPHELMLYLKRKHLPAR